MRGRCRPGRGVQRAAGRGGVRRPHPARHLATARAGDGADHVEHRGRSRGTRHASRASAVLAGRGPVLSAGVSGAGARAAGRRGGVGLRPGDALRSDADAGLLDGDSRDRGGRSADRRLFHLASRTARQWPQHSGSQHEQRSDAHVGRPDPAAEAVVDDTVPACGCRRRAPHPGAGHRCRGRIIGGAGAEPLGGHGPARGSGVAELRGGGLGDHPAFTVVRGAVRLGTGPASAVAAAGVRGRGVRRLRPRGVAAAGREDATAEA